MVFYKTLHFDSILLLQITVIAKHFIPPMMVNLILGSVLWTTYSETTSFLEPHLDSPIYVAALSGAVAGGAQALVAAPAENVRFVLEGGSPATGWSYAWKEVFRGTRSDPFLSKRDELHEARRVRDWMREVSDMAGRGWDGWKWGVAKDACGISKIRSQHRVHADCIYRFRGLLYYLRDDKALRRGLEERLAVVH